MSDHPSLADCWFCPLHKAVVAFATTVFDKLVGEVVSQLQQIEATGIYSDAYPHETLWDEYCHEVQEGRHDYPLERAWEDTLDAFLWGVVENIPRPEAVLLTIGARWELDEDDDDEPGELLAYPDLIRDYLGQAVSRFAGQVDMSRFDPNLPRQENRNDE